MTVRVALRAIEPGDLATLFAFGRDPEANRMAAFGPEFPDDRPAFDARRAAILANEGAVARAIVADDALAGSILHFEQFGDPAIGYWIGPAFWGRGIATRALAAFLDIVPTRPLHARAVSDNVASLRVLERNGFTPAGKDRGYSYARGREVEERLFVLRG